jgi:hypothetical protein
MAEKIRISENAVTGIAPITLNKTSKDVAFLDPRRYRQVDASIVSSSSSSNLLDSDFSYIDTDGFLSEAETNNVPQLEDIEVVENTTYVDDKGITRGKIVLKVRNSSGQKLLGVDARKAVLASAGGQS